jgi:hypothetical protein
VFYSSTERHVEYFDTFYLEWSGTNIFYDLGTKSVEIFPETNVHLSPIENHHKRCTNDLCCEGYGRCRDGDIKMIHVKSDVIHMLIYALSKNRIIRKSYNLW